MIKLATVFSGIGAVEHALSRMDIDNEIIFACDNGDIDVFSKNIKPNMDEIEENIILLKSIINDETQSQDNYIKQLLDMLELTEINFNDIKNDLDSSNIHERKNDIKNIISTILTTGDLNRSRLKHYTTFSNELDSDISLTQLNLLLYQIILKISNDFKRDNSLDDLGNTNISFISSCGINWTEINEPLKVCYDELEKENGKKIIRAVQTLSKRVGQLHGKISSLQHLNKFKNLNSNEAKKKYVDNLYRGNEKRNKVKISYQSNYHCPNEHYHWDVTFLDGTYYKNQVDLFVGGSPCQSFSIMGKQHGLSDTRGTLFYEYIRLVEEIQPKVFIYENVRAVLTNDCGRTWEVMKDIFNQLNYNVFYIKDDEPSILNAKDYGIPQNRKRLFVVGFRADLKLEKDFEFPKSLKLNKTMQDFLIENAPKGSFVPKHDITFNEDNLKDSDENNLEKYFLSEKIKKTVLSSGTKNFYSKPEIDLKIARPLVNSMHKMHRAGEDNYVTTNGKLRRLTPREALRLMGFSDDWKIVVSDTAMYQQAGNSIVVDVLINIIDEIIKSYPALLQDDN